MDTILNSLIANMMKQNGTESKDLDFLLLYANCIIKYRSLEDYVKKIDIDINSKSQNRGSYNPETRKITIFPSSIKDTFDSHLSQISLSEKEQEVYKFLLYLKTLFHELEHAYQVKKVIDGDTSIEGIILKHSSIISVDAGQMQNLLCRIYPRCVAYERMAEINAKRMILEIFKLQEIDYEHLELFLELKYLHDCLYGYGTNLNGITIEYLSFINRRLLNKLSWYSKDYNVYLERIKSIIPEKDERFMLGLAIDRKEYNDTLKRSKKIEGIIPI